MIKNRKDYNIAEIANIIAVSAIFYALY